MPLGSNINAAAGVGYTYSRGGVFDPPAALNDGSIGTHQAPPGGVPFSTYDGSGSQADTFFGYTFGENRNFARLIWQEGNCDAGGGNFTATPIVEVRVAGTWTAVSSATWTLRAYNSTTGTISSGSLYQIDFTPLSGNGVRLRGPTLNSAGCASAYELGVYEEVGPGGDYVAAELPGLSGAASTAQSMSATVAAVITPVHAIPPGVYPPVDFVGITNSQNTFQSGVTFSTPALAVEGNVLLFAMMLSGDPAIVVTPPSVAYQQVYYAPDPGGVAGYCVFSKIVGASEPATHAFTFSISCTSVGWFCAAYTYHTVGAVAYHAPAIGSVWTGDSVTVVNSDSRVLSIAWAEAAGVGENPNNGLTQTRRVIVDMFGSEDLQLCDDNPRSGPSGIRSGTCTLSFPRCLTIVLEGTAGASTDDPPTWPPATNAWTNISPAGVFGGAGGYFTQGITFSVSNPLVGYVAIINGPVEPFCGIWRTSDGGQTWTQKSGGAPLTGPDMPINIRINPADADHIYVADGVRGDRMGFWRSTNGGTTWDQPASFLAASPTIPDAYTVTTRPGTFAELLVTWHSPWGGSYGTSSGLLKSTDSGNTWSVIAPGAWTDGAGCGVAYLYDPALGIGSASRLLFACQSGGFWLSTDSGASWTQVYSLQNMDHGGMQVVITTAGIFVTSSGSILRSTDLGATWTAIGPGTVQTLALATDGTSLFTLRHAGSGQVQKALLSAPTSWAAQNTRVFSDGSFQMTYEPVSGRIYAANLAAGIWVYQQPVDGVLAVSGTIDGLTAAAATGLSMAGTVAGDTGEPTAAAVASQDVIGTSAGSIDGLAASAATSQSMTAATVAAVVDDLTAVAAASQAMSAATVAADMDGLTGSVVSAQALSATSAASMDPTTASASQSQTMAATVAADTGGLEGSATGSYGADVAGTVEALLEGLTAAAVVDQSMVSTVAAAMDGLTSAVVLTQAMAVSVAGVMEPPAASALLSIGDDITVIVAGQMDGLTASAALTMELGAALGAAFAGLDASVALSQDLAAAVTASMGGLTAAVLLDTGGGSISAELHAQMDGLDASVVALLSMAASVAALMPPLEMVESASTLPPTIDPVHLFSDRHRYPIKVS